MATFDTDIVIDIFQSISPSLGKLGTRSPWADTPHPGTGKKIQGWLWDKRTWPSDIEQKAVDYAPSIFDPSTNFILEEKFQSGIGDNKDLNVLKVFEEQAANVRYWTPRINHGHFYVYDQEWYLYSDDAVRDIFDSSVLSGVLQYKDLAFDPKPGVPISVRRYKWNSDKTRYDVDIDLRKKLDFTGIVTDGEEAETSTDNDYILANMDTSKDEFVVDWDRSPPRLILNRNYQDQIGTSGNLGSLELIGISDGLSNEYHTLYSPIDPSGVIQLISWDERSSSATESWSLVNSEDDFTPGGYNEFKLDRYLGTVLFGDYNEATTSGSGRIPPARHKVGIVYTAGLELTYEPEFSRDWIEPRKSDTNPFHNPMNQGFIRVSSQVTNPQWITLSSDLDGDALDGYNIDVGNTTGKVTARVISSLGEEMEGETVTFEILDPVYGTFSNLEETANAITNTDGEASVYFVPPSTIEDVGVATDTTVSGSNNTTLLSVDGLIAPDSLEDIYIFKVMIDDPVLGLPPEDEESFYTDFLTDEEIVEDPDGSSASSDFEKTYRTNNELPKPTFVENTNLSEGRKVIVASVDLGVIDPNYWIQAANDSDYRADNLVTGLTNQPLTAAPVVPITATTVGPLDNPALELTYSGQLETIDNETFKSYFVVCPATARLRAKVTNSVSGKTVYSNIINITINIPDSASGVQIIDSINDLQPELLSRIRHIDEISDATILTSSGELWDEYLEDRTRTSTTSFTQFVIDNSTIGYWPFESGSLHDISGNEHHALSYNMAWAEDLGIVGDGWKSTTPGVYAHLDAPGITQDLNMRNGTIDFSFKVNDETESGTTFTFFDITYTGANNRINSVKAVYEQTDLSGINFRFNYVASGENINNPDAYIHYNLLDSGINLLDTEWHSIRTSWSYNDATNQVTLAGVIDGHDITMGFPIAILNQYPIANPTNFYVTSEVIAADTLQSGGFYYDEIRYSDVVRTDENPPEHTVISEESYVDWFRRSRKADTNRLLLQNLTFSGWWPARAPLGFRLKSTGITVASMLDHVTFTTVNDILPSTYFDED